MSSTPPSTDDLFASLGGSLMKDLWADLQAGHEADEDETMMGWSLEQLERELSHLEDDGPSQSVVSSPGMPSAASLVVSHAQERLAQEGNYAKATNPTFSAADAWSQSLQNFTALSLEQDFLAADSVRKQTTTSTATPGIDVELLRNVQEYNVAEVATIQSPIGLTPSRPPGMPSPSPKQKPQAFSIEKLPVPPLGTETPEEVKRKTPPRRPLPRTPQNSQASIPPRVPPTPQNSSVDLDQTFSLDQTPIVATPVVGMIPPAGGTASAQQPVIAATPTKQTQAAWQTPSLPPPMPTRPVYCLPDPAAPPIPAAALESSCMNSRDLAYVLHSMLKPVLIAGVSPDDYDILLWQRRSGATGTPSKKSSNKLQKEMASREKKSKEWTAEHSTLGHMAKTNVARPRALIAVHAVDESTTAPNKERASLWKARIYVDQGYQAYNAVVQVWRSAPPGTVPRQIQPHMVKLLKCLGVKLESPPSTYRVDKDALSLLLKLPKGQVLLARILEQALLPPNAVQSLLPVALSIAIHSPFVDDTCNVRLFRSFAQVVSSLPNVEPSCLLESVKAVEDPDALKSQARMECIHALLRRGTAMSAQDPSFATSWAQAEQDFMKLLG
mmetsp:Transcript_21064/g.38253  ORF Transcript_21064/g.38253 Transcript_21064/m.38253 type:complete len:612 (-) Transcript_21064:31-1866(-)